CYMLTLLSILVACKVASKIPEEKFLDVNFSFPIAPAVGSMLTVNLYYTDSAGESIYEQAPDVVLQKALSEGEIADGVRMTFDDFQEVSYAYVSAHVDMDGDGEISDGDLATFHNDKSFKDIEEGYAVPENVAQEYAIDMIMRKIVGQDPLRDIDGNEYQTIVIGNQEWMAENLKVTRYRNGDPITSRLSDVDWAATTEGSYAIYPYADVTGINSEAQMI